MTSIGGTAIDDKRGTDADLAAGFVDMSAEDERGLGAIDEAADGLAAGCHAATGAIHRIARRGMGNNNEVTGVMSLSEAALEASGDFGFGDFVGRADGDGCGRATEEGDLIDLPAGGVDRYAELFERLIDGGRIHVAGDSQ